MSCAERGILFRQIDRLFSDGTLAGLGDGQLLERYLASGDETAFEALVNRHGPMVLGLCRRMLRDPRDIEDAFQGTFLVLVRTGPAIRDRSLVSTWLYRVAYRVARRARCQTLRLRSCEVPVAAEPAAVTPLDTDLDEIGPVLDQQLQRLPEKYRSPLVLCYLEGRTHEQAAALLRCPLGTVRSRLARGRELLKKRLTRRGFGPMTAILGAHSSLTARFLTETVPPSLVSATVNLALGTGSIKAIQSTAVSLPVLTLAQGVLTTMRFAQLKWIGLAVLATSLLTAGAVAVSYGAVRTSSAVTDASLGGAGAGKLSQSSESQPKDAARRFLKGWGEPIDPDGDCSIDLENDQLIIKVPGKRHGLEAELSTLNAPRVLRDIEGDFIVDLKLHAEFKPGERSTSRTGFPFVGAGLLLWSDPGNYIRLERAAIVTGKRLVPYFLFEERRDRRPVPPGGGIEANPEEATFLRLERKGDRVTGSVSADGIKWNAFPARTVRLPTKLKLGVAAVSSSEGPFTVTLENFRVMRPE
jgi:RNA polymerase sigma factor (sigma-70 family)